MVVALLTPSSALLVTLYNNNRPTNTIERDDFMYFNGIKILPVASTERENGRPRSKITIKIYSSLGRGGVKLGSEI